jgi:hypothetical protein
MIFTPSWKIRAFGALLFISLASGCFTERWHRDSVPSNNGIREDDRTREGGWNSDPNADRDGVWETERNSQDTPQAYSGNVH